MSEIIRVWLQTRLGLLFQNESWDQDKGGGVLATLLNSYTLLTDEQMKIILSKQGDVYAPTLEVMRLAITNLGITLDKDEYRDVLEAKGTAVVKLFYELFLVLHDKDTSDIILSRKLKAHIQCSRFSVSTRDESSEVSEEIEVEKFANPLAVSLSGNEEVISYHLSKYLELMKKCKETRNNYLNFLEHKREMEYKQPIKLLQPAEPSECPNRTDITELPVDAESLNQSMTELIKEGKRAMLKGCMKPDAKEASKIIKSIKNKARRTGENRGQCDTFRKKILKELWDKLVEEQEEYFKHQFIDKLQQQSLYEQQLTTCLMNVRKKHHEIANQKRELMDNISKQREEHAFNQLFDDEHKKDQERYEYYAEQNRKLTLHKQICERKAERAETQNIGSCDDIMKDILDIAFYTIDYEETNCQPLPRRKRDDLARLFIAKQPIFDLLQDVTEILSIEPHTSNDSLRESEGNETETITQIELERQNAMDDLTFDDYLNYKWPWDFNSWMEFPEYIEMGLGLNIIGHAIHRFLHSKYSGKAGPTAPSVPHTEVAVCLDGLHNLSYLPALAQLLHAKKIEVIQLQDAFDYCLAAYKKETTDEALEEVLEDATNAALKDMQEKKSGKIGKKSGKKGSKAGSAKSSKRKSKSRKSKTSSSDKMSKKSAVSTEIDQPEIATFADKTNQTPERFPDEEVHLSDAASVGKNLFEVINLGQVPDEYLHAAAFVEYLNSLNFNDINGWVLVNYPQTIQQAVILEETLSCVKIPAELKAYPPDNIFDVIALEERPYYGDDSLEQKKMSLLIPNPACSLDDDLDYDTFLTAFIEMRTPDKNDPDELLFDCLKSPENTAALCKFYQSQGCKYTLYYDKIDFNTIKHLGKLILGDYSMPPKDSETLFTDTVHYVEANFDELAKTATTSVVKEGEKQVKKGKKGKSDKKDKSSAPKSEKSIKSKSEKSSKSSKKSKKEKNEKKGKKEKKDKHEKKEKKDKKGKKDKKDSKGKGKGKGKSKKSEQSSAAGVEMEDEETQIPTPVPEPEEIEEPPLPPPLPGEYRWIYHDLPLMPYYEEALATLWENIENIYINDMKQLFFHRRTIMDALIPYNTYVKNNLLEFIRRPDLKQQYLTEFQLLYNDFEDDIREDEEVKCELHLRIEEFREKLWKICDARMLENEQERVRVVQDNWVTTQLIDLCNIYVTLIQLELDRSTDTTQMMADYYTAMLTGAPCKDSALEKITLEIIPLPKTIEDMDHVAPFVEFTENAMQRVGPSAKDKEDKEVENKKTKDKKNLSDNPYLNKIKFCLDQARDRLVDNLDASEKALRDLKSKFNPKEAKGKEKKSKKGSDKASTIVTVVTEPEEDAKQHCLDLLQELEIACKGEYFRCDLRFKILEHAFVEELDDMLEKSGSSFDGLYKYIEQRYKKEIHAVDQASKLLKRAVEEETSIQPEMLLQNDMFYIKLGSLMYESPLPEDDDVPVCERNDDEIFSISQLQRIADVLFRLAPSFVIPTKAFTFLLQEFLVYQGEDGQEDYVPKAWKQLPPHKVQQLVTKLFDTIDGYIDWKDFIIYALAISCPTEDDVLNTRTQFRDLDPDMTEFILEHQYPQIKFWFEDEVEEPRLTNLRELLLRLFSIEGKLNYTALLLAFCKDEDPVLGLVKAIEVSLGKYIIYDEQGGSWQYRRSLKKIMRRELNSISRNKDRYDTENISREVIDKLIDDTVNTTTSVILNAVGDDDLEPLCTYDIMQYLTEPKRPLSTNDDKVTPTASECEYTEMDFTNSGTQGFMAKEAGEFQVGFDVFMNIFTVMMPWLHRMKSFGELTFHERFAILYNSLINEDVRTAFVYQILSDADFMRMFKTFYRFYDRNLVDIVRKLLQDECA